MDFGYKLWDLLNKKIIRSKNIVFLGDKLVNHANKAIKPSSYVEIPISLDPISPSLVHDDHKRDVKEDGDTINDDSNIVDDVKTTT